MTRMPHDKWLERSVDAGAATEIERLRDENAQLRTLLVEVLRAMKEVELVLQRALDKDRKQN